ncbi:MAG: type II toxin-antitoxin system VapC family toxin [Pyrinomonadaceae bacterium]|nr:type II toxin-antitoxin system VapC family toxin [Pyrinomonadaceae bacterium]
MKILDTHIWIWLVDQNPQLTKKFAEAIRQDETDGLGASVISCWEAAKLVEAGRLQLSLTIEDWIEAALNHPNLRLLELTPEIVVASTKLPSGFHKDPADQMTVATARIYNVPLVTMDEKIRNYPHVKLLP